MKAVSVTAAILSLALVVAACTGVPMRTSRTSSPPDAAYPTSTGDSTERQDRAALTPPAPALSAPAVAIGDLMGADEMRLHRLLGLPQFRRNDPPARLLRYRAPACLLDLFLYPRDGDHRVTHIEARGHDGKDRPAPACLDAVLKARAAAKTG